MRRLIMLNGAFGVGDITVNARVANQALRSGVFAVHIDTDNVDPDRVLRDVLGCVGMKLDASDGRVA